MYKLCILFIMCTLHCSAVSSDVTPVLPPCHDGHNTRSWQLRDTDRETRDNYLEDTKCVTQDSGGDCVYWGVINLQPWHVHCAVQRYFIAIPEEIIAVMFCSWSNWEYLQCSIAFQSNWSSPQLTLCREKAFFFAASCSCNNFQAKTLVPWTKNWIDK